MNIQLFEEKIDRPNLTGRTEPYTMTQFVYNIQFMRITTIDIVFNS